MEEHKPSLTEIAVNSIKQAIAEHNKAKMEILDKLVTIDFELKKLKKSLEVFEPKKSGVGNLNLKG